MAALSAINETGKPVDWWFIYKVPKDAPIDGKSGKATGYEYLYADKNSPAPKLSANLLEEPKGALGRTLQQLGGSKSTANYFFYNDEFPPGVPGSNNGDCGHCKGVLAFDVRSNTALWLVHSVPRFPVVNEIKLPVDEVDYGQTLLCITLKDVTAAADIATQMLTQQVPQVYDIKLPNSGVWTKIKNKQFTPSPSPTTVSFTSKGGQKFDCVAKSRTWGQDLWTSLVAPKIMKDPTVDVESWRRGTVPPSSDKGFHGVVQDVIILDLKQIKINPPYSWHNTKDHAKWAVSVDGEHEWTAIADINRQVSQYKRGGAAVCFQIPPLRQSLSNIITSAKKNAK